ncbi:LOLA3 protein, partial [Acromyrmex insinuator]
MRSIKIPCPNPNCRSVFAWKKNLISHLRYQCGQQPRFKCPYCDYLCKIKTDVRKHIRVKHQNYDVHVIDIFQQKSG